MTRSTPGLKRGPTRVRTRASVAIVETNDSNALRLWLLKRNDAIDIQTVPVFDDDEARKLVRQALG